MRKLEFKEDFLKLAKKIKRERISDLLKYLDKETDFFIAPASTKFHSAAEEGLVLHSLTVYDCACHLSKNLSEVKFATVSLEICTLFHDICKANFYSIRTRNKKINGNWVAVEEYYVNDQLPMGHGEKSVYLLNKFINLSDEEALAIRWHQGGYDPSFHFFQNSTSGQKAFRENQLAAVVAAADFTASYLYEDWYKEEN